MSEDPLELVGQCIDDKYDVGAFVASGGTALVYRAMHRLWKRSVAIKFFRVSGLPVEGRAEVLDRFAREGQLLTELSERSTTIVQARDIGTFTTRAGEWLPYMVLEWLEGETLESVLEKEQAEGVPRRDVPEAIAFLTPVAEALALAHSRGIAHRDVKPSNIFVVGAARSPTCNLKVLDFGIAKVVSDAQFANGAFRKTSGDFTSFTPAYGAPEQFSRAYGATGPWTDVFGLALVLIEVVTGRPPLEGESIAQLARAATRSSVRPSIDGSAPQQDAVDGIIARALSVRPEDRYRTVDEFWNRLRSANASPIVRRSLESLPESPDRPTQVTLDAPMPVSRSLRRRTVASLCFGLLACVGVATAVGATKRTTKQTTREPVVAKIAASLPPAAVPAASCPHGTVTIPGGSFFMGSDEKTDLASERPAHKVSLQPYCMDRFEVTTEEFVACSNDGACKRASRANNWDGITAAEQTAFDPLCNMRDLDARARHPINCVDWSQAVQFCENAGMRLPTEAEWEFAARGPDGRRFPWGDEEPSAGLANVCGSECLAWGKQANVDEREMFSGDDGWPNTAPVGSFPRGASRYGVEDVVGNVWEWVADWYAPYAPDEQVSPKGPKAGATKVIRGGAWNASYPAWVRPTFRYQSGPTTKSYGIGFRCAKSL